MLPLLFATLLAGPARADEPLTGPQRKAAAEARAAEDAARAAEEAAAQDVQLSCPADISESVVALRAKVDKDAYDCLITTDGADAAILAMLATMEPTADPASDGERNRLTRALALYDIARLDQGIADEHVRALGAADRRLVRDAVHARRGRASPSEEHEGVFEKLGWYKPDPSYTNTRLTDVDRQVIEKIDHPPAPPGPEKPETAAEAMAATAAAPEQQAKPGLCSCAAAPSTPWLSLTLLPLVVVARRRR